jgi:hypothetical protein
LGSEYTSHPKKKHLGIPKLPGIKHIEQGPLGLQEDISNTMRRRLNAIAMTPWS